MHVQYCHNLSCRDNIRDRVRANVRVLRLVLGFGLRAMVGAKVILDCILSP